MENFNIEATQYMPNIDFNVGSGILDISGKSYPENTFDFYAPVIEWVKEYFKNAPAEKTLVNLDLEYLNSSSLKAYFELFDILEAEHDNHAIEIKWIFDADNDISEETGEDFMLDFESLNIELVTK